jgi:hypothetical protein
MEINALAMLLVRASSFLCVSRTLCQIMAISLPTLLALSLVISPRLSIEKPPEIEQALLIQAE